MKLSTLSTSLLSVAALSVSATILTYTENDNSGNNRALGYPVPIPVDSQLPVDGFRSYDYLHARHQDLANTSANISAHIVGQSRRGENIWAYVLSDSNAVSESSIPEPVMLQNGGIHAREWQSPEVVTGIMERLYNNESDQGFYQYLLENNKIILIPVLNVDGFKQTQAYPNQVMQSTYFDDPSSWPRDGRMRRKNTLGADSQLATENDNLQGVDLNRNNNPYWATSNRSSGNTGSLVHHGANPASEPETQALQAAAALGPAAELRFYIDTHSFTRIYFTPLTGNPRRDALTESLASAMRAVNNNRYDFGPSSAGSGIGATDEYFAYTYEIPSYTLEIEPTTNGSIDYGGFGVSHDGFILPESEIARVRNELAASTLLGYYIQSGPPSVQKIEIQNASDNSIVFSAQWSNTSAATRQLAVATNLGLNSDTNYRLKVSFNKPMRWHQNGQLLNYPGLSLNLLPNITLEGKAANGNVFSQSITTANGNWVIDQVDSFNQFENYKADTFITNFSVSANTAELSSASLLQLAIDSTDMAGQSLDANPATVIDWQNGAWSNFESSNGIAEDNGGIDRQVRLVDDGSPRFQPPTNNSSRSSGGAFSLAHLFLLLLLYRKRNTQELLSH